MRKAFLLFLLAAAKTSAAGGSADFSQRIQQAQNSLLSHGSSAQVLSEYDELISAMARSAENVSKTALAQVHYQRSLIEISLSKSALAVADLIEALAVDPSFAPASKKLQEMWLDRGSFHELRENFPPDAYPQLYSKMGQWDAAYEHVVAVLDSKNTAELDHCVDLVDGTILPITPSNALAYELRLKVWKQKAVVSIKNGESVPYGEIVRDYAKLVRLSPQRRLDQYSEFSQYLLFTRGSFEEAWNTVRGGLRMDNDHKTCGFLSKMYNRLQHVLKSVEQYFILHDYLYPGSDSLSDLPDEKLRDLSVDLNQVYADLTGPVTLSKRDMKTLPSGVKSVYDFLLHRAQEFTFEEFGDRKLSSALPLVEVLYKLMCEASAHGKGNKKKFCALVDDSGSPFLPKHLAHIDSLLKKKDYNAAKQLLAAYNKNVQKTELFQKRWTQVQEFEHRQQQQHRQQQHQQHQQRQQHHYRQQQQQQQQQSKFDRSKDYYKILDVSKDADEKTLKKAYRTQTLKYHPDKYKEKDLSEREIESKMQDINEAYEVLSDPASRQDYDRPQEQQHGGHFQQNHGAQNVHFNFDPEQFMGHFGQGGFKFQF